MQTNKQTNEQKKQINRFYALMYASLIVSSCGQIRDADALLGRPIWLCKSILDAHKQKVHVNSIVQIGFLCFCDCLITFG